jgi:hypothetical protein
MSAAFTSTPRFYRGHDGVREVFRVFEERIENSGPSRTN